MIPVKVLAARVLPNAPNALLEALDTKYPCLALLTTDCDDATYIALDEATKAARAEVVYGRSCYAGADNATQPNTGEVIGILGAETPGDAKSALEAALGALEHIGFEDAGGVSCLAYTVSSCGTYLAKEAGVSLGSALAYLIAPPLESIVGLDAAMKAADVELKKFYGPPTETNFGGALLTGTRSACAAACEAFREAVEAVSQYPLLGEGGQGEALRGVGRYAEPSSYSLSSAAWRRHLPPGEGKDF